MVRKLHLNEESNDYYKNLEYYRSSEYAESGEWYADLWNAYLDDESYTCSCCGKKFPPASNSVIFNKTEPDGMHFIYKITGNNRVGNNINYDPYHLPKEDNIGQPFKVIVYNENDDEGYHWRNFCRNCWPKLKKYTPEELAKMFKK